MRPTPCACRGLDSLGHLTVFLSHANLSVHLSVRYIPVFYENRLTYCHNLFSTRYSPIILVLSASNTFAQLRGYPLWCAKCRWGIKILRFSTKNRYILQMIQDSATVTMKR